MPWRSSRRHRRITSVDQILGNPTMRTVVTTALGIPEQIAFQPLEAQEKAISSQLNITQFQDPKFVESFVQHYLITNGAQLVFLQQLRNRPDLAGGFRRRASRLIVSSTAQKEPRSMDMIEVTGRRRNAVQRARRSLSTPAASAPPGRCWPPPGACRRRSPGTRHCSPPGWPPRTARWSRHWRSWTTASRSRRRMPACASAARTLRSGTGDIEGAARDAAEAVIFDRPTRRQRPSWARRCWRSADRPMPSPAWRKPSRRGRSTRSTVRLWPPRWKPPAIPTPRCGC